MAILPRQFNAHEFDPASSGNQLPVSDAKGHLCIITNSEFKASKSNSNNGYVEFTLEVVDGPSKGASGAWRLNLFHENPKTVDIANSQLSALCHVTGQMLISDTTQLHNIPFRAVVVAKPFKNEKGEEVQGTEVKGVLDVNGEKPKRNAQGAAPTQAQAPSFAQPQTQAAPAQPQTQTAPAWAPQQPQQAAPAWAPQTQAAPTQAQAPWGSK